MPFHALQKLNNLRQKIRDFRYLKYLSHEKFSFEYVLIPKGNEIRHIHDVSYPVEASQFDEWKMTDGNIGVTLKLKEKGIAQVRVGENMVSFIDRYFVPLY